MEVCNVLLKDNTGEIRAVFWTQNIRLIKTFSEGDTIQIKGVDIKEGYTGLEANLMPRSTSSTLMTTLQGSLPMRKTLST